MGRKAHAQRLNIWLNGESVGHWDAKPGNNVFAYHEQWLSAERGRPLSLSLPFRPGNEAYRGAIVQNFFDNLLPDSDPIRRRIAQRFNTEGIEPHQLLSAVGRDCVGAIQLLPADEVPADIFSIQSEALSEADIARLLRNTVAEPGFGHHENDDDLRLSIAGAQEKSALLWHQGRWCRPIGSTPTTHILKLPIGLVGDMQADMRTSVENEWLCSKIAAAFGLPVAHCDIAQFEDMKALVVERFDRRPAADGRWIVRLPQEDFCQATGTSPLQKYQSHGGPGISKIMEILLGSNQAELDRRRFFKTQILFWLLAATDGHAKNFSIRHLPGAEYALTPLYDILSAHPVAGTGANQIAPQRLKLAMAVRGSENYYLMSQIMRRHWTHHAGKVGLGADAAEQIIAETLDAVPSVVNTVTAMLPSNFPTDIADGILEGLVANAVKLRLMPA